MRATLTLEFDLPETFRTAVEQNAKQVADHGPQLLPANVLCDAAHAATRLVELSVGIID